MGTSCVYKPLTFQAIISFLYQLSDFYNFQTFITFQKQNIHQTSTNMSDAGRKDFSTKAKESVIPDSSKSTQSKVSEAFTDTGDKLARYVFSEPLVLSNRY